jgi:hypothetical protein
MHSSFKLARYNFLALISCNRFANKFQGLGVNNVVPTSVKKERHIDAELLGIRWVAVASVWKAEIGLRTGGRVRRPIGIIEFCVRRCSGPLPFLITISRVSS